MNGLFRQHRKAEAFRHRYQYLIYLIDITSFIKFFDAMELFTKVGTQKTVGVVSGRSKAIPCDLLEWHDDEALDCANGLPLRFTPFEIKTFKLK